MAKQSLSIKTKVVTVFALATIAVAGVGWVAYNSLNQLLDTLYIESRPDEKLNTLETILDEITSAENSVRAYTITRDASYLNPYYNSISDIAEKVRRLRFLSQVDSAQLSRIDTIESLIEEKFVILNNLIAVKSDDRVRMVLEKVKKNIALAEVKEQTISKIEQKEPNLFERIFTQKEHTNSDGQEAIKLDAKEIKEAVSEIEKEEQKTSQKQAAKALAYFNEDKIVTGKLRALLEEMEQKELILSKKRATEASESTAQTIDVIKIICIAAFVLFLLLIYVLFIDITRSNRYRKNLQKAKDKAERLALAKEEFLSNMSHEIRTPLNSIVGFAEQLDQTSLNKGQTDFLNVIKKSSEHLLVLINDILDYAKIETGKLTLEKIPFKPLTTVEETHQSLYQKAMEKGISFHYSMEKSVPEIVLGDPIRLKQILLNLVSNAIKFTEVGKVEIKGSAEILTKDRAMLHLCVMDTGIGIPEGKSAAIFQSFDQLDNSVTRKYGGTGLGLAITKKLVEMQNGTIAVTSKVNKGTTVSFSLPYKISRASHLKPKQVKKPMNLNAFKGISILVVDDEEYNLLLAKSILEKWRTKTTLAQDGEQTIEKLRHSNFDLVLMDIQMPGMSGIETAEYIRNSFDKEKATVPIIALTAGVSKSEEEKCRQAGIDEFITKPFKEYELYHKLIKVLYKQVEHPRLNPNEEKQAPCEQYNLKELRDLANGDTEFMINMIGIFIENATAGVESIMAGVEKRNWEKVSVKAHKICPSYSHMGLKNMAETLKEIERIALEGSETHRLPAMARKLYSNTKTVVQKLKKEKKGLKSQQS